VVKRGAQVSNSVLMEGAVIEEGARVEYAILAPGTRVCADGKVGCGRTGDGSHPISVLGQGAVVEKGAEVPSGSILSAEKGA